MCARSTSGALPNGEPVPYVTDDPLEARTLLAGGVNADLRRWYHATRSVNLASIVWYGLAPGCWLGGDSCVVFGIDRRTEVPSWRRGDPVLEIVSAAPASQAKALWVPPHRLVGVWQRSEFVEAEHLRREIAPPARPVLDGCLCPLSEICREQQQIWAATGVE
jgi:hypothetical protein